MNNKKQKNIERRAFSGIVGSPLSGPVLVPPIQSLKVPAKPHTKNLVLLHYCFDQGAGETKREWCPCKERVAYNLAEHYVDEGRADWLLMKHFKKPDPVRTHRSIVVRRMVVDNEELFAIPPKLVGQNSKESKSKAVIRRESRRLLNLCCANGEISETLRSIPDDELDRLIENPASFLVFHQLVGRHMERLFQYWWSMLLKGRKLSVNQGKYMLDADPSKGLLVTGGYEIHKIGYIDEKQRSNTGRVAGPSGVARGYTVQSFGKIYTVWDKSSYCMGASPEEDTEYREEEDFNSKHDLETSKLEQWEEKHRLEIERH